MLEKEKNSTTEITITGLGNNLLNSKDQKVSISFHDDNEINISINKNKGLLNKSKDYNEEVTVTSNRKSNSQQHIIKQINDIAEINDENSEMNRTASTSKFKKIEGYEEANVEIAITVSRAGEDYIEEDENEYVIESKVVDGDKNLLGRNMTSNKGVKILDQGSFNAFPEVNCVI